MAIRKNDFRYFKQNFMRKSKVVLANEWVKEYIYECSKGIIDCVDYGGEKDDESRSLKERNITSIS